jgi:hypothetical protein
MVDCRHRCMLLRVCRRSLGKRVKIILRRHTALEYRGRRVGVLTSIMRYMETWTQAFTSRFSLAFLTFSVEYIWIYFHRNLIWQGGWIPKHFLHVPITTLRFLTLATFKQLTMMALGHFMITISLLVTWHTPPLQIPSRSLTRDNSITNLHKIEIQLHRLCVYVTLSIFPTNCGKAFAKTAYLRNITLAGVNFW